MEQEEQEEFVFFWETTSPFSQWHPVGFHINGVYYKTAEHYMMWGKAMLFGDETIAADILHVKHPRDVKALGRKIKNFDSKLWEEQCQNIVYQGNYAKFTQNKEMRLALRATGTAELVESSPNDKIWGIGLAADDPKALNRETWEGTNFLGEVLMSVREKMRFEMNL